MKDNNKLKSIVFFFDSSMIDEFSYGDVVFENIIKGREITLNSSKIIFSRGDIVNKAAYNDINPFVIKDDLCTITKINKSFSDYLYVCILEDIEQQIAIKIDSRLKDTFFGLCWYDINRHTIDWLKKAILENAHTRIQRRI